MYVDFLKRCDLGSQYPAEDFDERIALLVKNAQISIVAKDDTGKIVGVCLGLTDYAYWLMVTDLGVDRSCGSQGIGRALVERCHEIAGGRDRIIMFINANEDALTFYEKIGMSKEHDGAR